MVSMKANQICQSFQSL